MRIVRSISEFRSVRSSLVQNGKKLGFVPTMGFLHHGHMSLIQSAKKENQIVAASIFVNPTQFGPNEDFDRYPRSFDRDSAMLEKEGVDIIFAPSKEEMYPPRYKTFVSLENIDSSTREGTSRPGFFRGVATVCSKLFNIVQPDNVYFGQKDGIQCIVIKTMVNNLNFPINVVICPTIRESDGLAMSSRNSYLSPEERKIAPTIYQALKKAEEQLKVNKKGSYLISVAKSIIDTRPELKLDYFNLADLENGSEVDVVENQGAMLSTAVWLGKTRLIDNIILKP